MGDGNGNDNAKYREFGSLDEGKKGAARLSFGTQQREISAVAVLLTT